MPSVLSIGTVVTFSCHDCKRKKELAAKKAKKGSVKGSKKQNQNIVIKAKNIDKLVPDIDTSFDKEDSKVIPNEVQSKGGRSRKKDKESTSQAATGAKNKRS